MTAFRDGCTVRYWLFCFVWVIKKIYTCAYTSGAVDTYFVDRPAVLRRQ